jgi:hypothetical protein
MRGLIRFAVECRDEELYEPGLYYTKGLLYQEWLGDIGEGMWQHQWTGLIDGMRVEACATLGPLDGEIFQ